MFEVPSFTASKLDMIFLTLYSRLSTTGVGICYCRHSKGESSFVPLWLVSGRKGSVRLRPPNMELLGMLEAEVSGCRYE